MSKMKRCRACHRITRTKIHKRKPFIVRICSECGACKCADCVQRAAV